MAAASSICQISPTRCQARTRLYRDGKLELEGFPVADISDYLADGSVTIWLDLRVRPEDREAGQFAAIHGPRRTERGAGSGRANLCIDLHCDGDLAVPQDPHGHTGMRVQGGQ
jgi:hypothetical protein